MKEIYIDGQKIPTAFQTEVIVRMFIANSKGFEDFIRNYRKNKKISTVGEGKIRQKPSEMDYEIALRYKSGVKARQLSLDSGKSLSSIKNLIHRVAMWEMLHS